MVNTNLSLGYGGSSVTPANSLFVPSFANNLTPFKTPPISPVTSATTKTASLVDTLKESALGLANFGVKYGTAWGYGQIFGSPPTPVEGQPYAPQQGPKPAPDIHSKNEMSTIGALASNVSMPVVIGMAGAITLALVLLAKGK